ncbi:MAG: response regulator [endosymbiont of Galathealinum brachiosum]|uniref:Response regulator n=1 Tax=endosymbiont of Galathealinum brachiosum TaxID=2200906 RepID=A0A370DLB4_9GAMM|nr:MAG: response regulator [endosymbiont of Galathealinum brachiosum]
MKKILVVDDEAPVRKMLRSMFKNDNYEIVEADNGVTAKAMCLKGDIDLIITDIVMPEKHGVDLVMELKKEVPDLPIIAISGGGGVSGRFDYLEIANLMGADNILRKPFEAKDLRDIVHDVLGNKHE